MGSEMCIRDRGDPLSPNLFNAVLEQIFKKLDWAKKGVSIKIRGANLFEFKKLNHLRFADDKVIIARNGAELRSMVEDLGRESLEMGLTMNLSKTKVMSNIKNLTTIRLGGGAEIERVHEYKYLGQTLSFENKLEKELEVRRANAWKAFWSLKSIFKSKMKLSSKIRILESAVIPVLTYGAQTWAATSKQTQKIQKTQNAMLRSILGLRLKDRVRIEEIFNKSKAKKVGVVTRKLKYKYAGHIVRDTKYKWNKILTL